MIPIHDTKNKSKPIQLTTQNYTAKVSIHDNFPDPDSNLISHGWQNIGELSLQDGTMNIDDLFRLTVDPELSLPAALEIILDTTKYHLCGKINSTKKPFLDLKFLIYHPLLVQQTTINLVVSYYVQMGK